jgi:hypothetical protein
MVPSAIADKQTRALPKGRQRASGDGGMTAAKGHTISEASRSSADLGVPQTFKYLLVILGEFERRAASSESARRRASNLPRDAKFALVLLCHAGLCRIRISGAT